MVKSFGKRGQEDKIYFLIWEFIVLVMVIVALTVAVRSISNNNTYWKKYLSSDLAMITDLTYAGQGDFMINYNMKQVGSSTVSKILLSDGLSFQTFLKPTSIYVYSPTSADDKFPQSFIFAGSPSVTVSESNVSTEFLVLYKSGGSLILKDGYVAPVDSCPAVNTQKDINGLKFDAVALSTQFTDQATYTNELLKIYGAAATGKELAIFFVADDSSASQASTLQVSSLQAPASQAVTIYYDNDLPVIGGKLACILGSSLGKNYPGQSVNILKYDKSLDTNAAFTGSKANYAQWIIIKIPPAGLDKVKLASSIKDALVQYYG
jgi:hypothetical protein